MSTPAIQLVPIEQVQLNPANPRIIQDHRFAALKQSIQDFPDMFQARPLVVDEDFVVLGGNMRLQALLQLRHTHAHIIQVTGWSEQQKREFVIKDNASFGEWDWEALANEWSDLPLGEWIDLPRDWMKGDEPEPEGEEAGAGPTESSIKIVFASPDQCRDAQAELGKLLEKKKYEGAELTVTIK